jgi:polyisoprenyl-phosphate glycosyltransferase
MMRIHLSIIIPFLNEEENIGVLVNSLNNFCSSYKDTVEVIFVNDGSTDNSEQLLIQASHAYKAKIVSFSKNFGSHEALRAGMVHAGGGDRVTFMYADLQDPLELIYRLNFEMDKQNDIVWATRLTKDISFTEKIFSRSYSSLMRRYAIKTFPENGFDIVMLSRKVVDEVNKNPESNSSIFLQILSLGFKQVSIEYHKEARKAGKSKWTFSKKVKMFIDSFVAFSYLPIRLVTLVGILLFIGGLFWTAYIVLRKLMLNDLEEGWPALVSILMTGFGITNISLGIIAEYLWRTLDVARRRPIYIIDKVTEINYE